MGFGEQIDVSSWDGGGVDVEVDLQVDTGYSGDVESWLSVSISLLYPDHVGSNDHSRLILVK